MILKESQKAIEFFIKRMAIIFFDFDNAHLKINNLLDKYPR